jgi:hypothetical protein
VSGVTHATRSRNPFLVVYCWIRHGLNHRIARYRATCTFEFY